MSKSPFSWDNNLIDPEGGAPREPDQARRRRYATQRVRRPRPDRNTLVIAGLLVLPVVFGVILLALALTNPLQARRSDPTPTLIELAEALTATQSSLPTPVPSLVIEAAVASPLPPATRTLAPTDTPPPLTPVFSVTPPLFISATPQGGFVAPFAGTRSFNLIVYVCYIGGIDELCVMNPDGSNQRQITDFRVTSYYPSWSPDGSRIIFSSQIDGNFELYSVAPDGSDLQRLTYTTDQDEYAPDYSPDGTMVVYTGSKGGSQDIWLMSADGSNQRPITFEETDDLDPTFAPDGAQISFASTRDGPKDLYVMNISGGDVRRITWNISLGGRNDWSADGRFLTFYRGAARDKNIYLISTACAARTAEPGCRENPVRLTTGGNNKGPTFSPDGQWVAFAANRGSDNDIYIIRVDGQNLRQLTFNPYAEWQPRWQP